MSTVLIVDAPDADASLLASALRVDGFSVHHGASAVMAREILATEPVSFVLLDLMLRSDGAPHGLELARELKAAYPQTRFFLTSAYLLSERQLERADCGVSGFIPKPYDVAEVVGFLRAKLSGPPSARPWPAPASGVVPKDTVASVRPDPLVRFVGGRGR